jgi:hypothetical protein
MEFTEMDWVRAAIANALIEEMTVFDLYEMAQHAETVESFEDAVNILSNTMPVTEDA